MDLFGFNELVQSIDMEKVVETAFFNNEAEIIDTIQDKQLQRGIDGVGSQIGSYSTRSYAEMKYLQNSRAGFGQIDLKLTGDWYSGMMLSKVGDEFQVDSSDSKNDKLKRQYGADIMGLTDENAGELAQDYFLEDIIGQLRETLDV